MFQDISKDLYKQKVEPTLLLPKQLGNSYTASLYTGLLSLIATKNDAELVIRIPHIIKLIILDEQKVVYVLLWKWSCGHCWLEPPEMRPPPPEVSMTSTAIKPDDVERRVAHESSVGRV